MASLFDILKPPHRALLKAAKLPRWTPPMLATLTRARFSDRAWIFERRLDGQRTLAFVSRGHVRLLSRNRCDISYTYPELSDALSRRSRHDFLVDVEAVAFVGP